MPFYRYDDLEIEEDLIERLQGYMVMITSQLWFQLVLSNRCYRNTSIINTERIRDYLTAVSFFEIIGFGSSKKIG